MKRNVINIHTMKQRKFRSLDFQGKWERMFGKPERNFRMMIYGPSTSGKSTLALEFADYLALKFAKTFYNSHEEGWNKTLADRAERIGIKSKRLFIGNQVSFDEMMERIKRCYYRYIFIDSVQFAKLTYEQYQELIKTYPKKSFIFISQGSGKGKTDGANRILFAVDIKVYINNGTADIWSRYRGESSKVQLFKPPQTTNQLTLL